MFYLATLLVPFPLSYRSLYGSRTLPAHHARTRRSNVAHRRRDMGHLRAPKCGSLRRSSSLAVLHPSSLILHPFQCGEMWGSTRPTLSPSHIIPV
jgi:hypothetical protein